MPGDDSGDFRRGSCGVMIARLVRAASACLPRLPCLSIHPQIAAAIAALLAEHAPEHEPQRGTGAAAAVMGGGPPAAKQQGQHGSGHGQHLLRRLAALCGRAEESAANLG